MKKGVFVVGLLSLLLLSGCSAFGNSHRETSSVGISSMDKKNSVAYEKLSKAAKRQVKFDFTAEKADSGYDINVNIKNESKHLVRFDFADFKIFSPVDRDYESDRSGNLVVKPHEACGITHLFVGLNKDTLNDPSNYFVYIDPNYKLSKFTFRIATGTSTKEANEMTSTNDNHVTTNVDAPKAAFSNGTSNSTNAADSGSSDVAGSASSGSESISKPTAPAKILDSTAIAKALYLHSMGFTAARGEDVDVVSTDYGYKVTDNALSGSANYYNDSGDELDDNGNVIATFSSLAGPTAADPEGFIYKNSNYSQY
ncbi:hypothetical protein [Companilactobacillus furfuricola]|uniref:hypothetical protein n=1 Tax=Companilactobacillus furfuricola TaxID=1462575 RepID=UPI000F7AD802|nr:hypothetical protein [Companilactobacillus furfuricola]